MKEADPIKNDSRRARRERRLGPDAACIHCGVTTPELLKLTRCRLVQGHHIVGEANDPELIAPHCQNCHAIESEGQRIRGVNLRRDVRRTVPETLIVIAAEAGLFLLALAGRLLEWSRKQARFVAGLDRDFPAWRDMPEAEW